jgi:hypothetical protein
MGIKCMPSTLVVAFGKKEIVELLMVLGCPEISLSLCSQNHSLTGCLLRAVFFSPL